MRIPPHTGWTVPILNFICGRICGSWGLLRYVFTRNVHVEAGDENQNGRKDKEDVSSEERILGHSSIGLLWRRACTLPDPSPKRKCWVCLKAVRIITMLVVMALSTIIIYKAEVDEDLLKSSSPDLLSAP